MKSQAEMLALAISITSEAFVNKLDKGGQPYIFHCLRVMNRMPDNDYELQQIAVMHDLVEDCAPFWNFTKLQTLGFSERVLDGLVLVTHINGTYEDYINDIGMSGNTDALAVKLADLKDNSNITRLKGISEKDIERMIKYHKAFLYLNSL